jgi:hypothetical protein
MIAPSTESLLEAEQDFIVLGFILRLQNVCQVSLPHDLSQYKSISRSSSCPESFIPSNMDLESQSHHCFWAFLGAGLILQSRSHPDLAKELGFGLESSLITI